MSEKMSEVIIDEESLIAPNTETETETKRRHSAPDKLKTEKILAQAGLLSSINEDCVANSIKEKVPITVKEVMEEPPLDLPPLFSKIGIEEENIILNKKKEQIEEEDDSPT